MNTTLHDAIQTIGNWLSGVAVIATLVGILPPLAAFVAVVWYVIQIRESQTVQDYLKARRQRRMNRLRERLMVLQTIDKVENIKEAVKTAGAAAVQDVVDKVKPKTQL
jgi:hypothetical protein